MQSNIKKCFRANFDFAPLNENDVPQNQNWHSAFFLYGIIKYL